MKKQIISMFAAAILFAVASFPLFASEEPASEEMVNVEEMCQKLAMDENIAVENMEQYIADCIADNTEEGAATEEEEPSK